MTLEIAVTNERDVAVETILSDVQASAVRLVRFLFCDTAGIIRGKAVHVKQLRQRIEGGVGIVKGTLAMNILDQLQGDTGFGAVGEVRMVPDPSTFLILPYAQQSAMMICDLVELDHSSWSLCPRTILKRQLAKAREAGVTFQVAFEPEFLLGRMDENGQFAPLDESLCFSTEGMNAANDFINRFSHALEAQGIDVQQYYSELGHGQHELSVSHVPALQACDQQIIYRETLRGVAFDMGIVAMLAPKPFADGPGNGGHLHLSAWDTSGTTNLFFSTDGSGTLTEFGMQFVAGLLKHLPALVALTCPTVNSYRRLKPKSWSSAYTCWGYENREAAVRVPTTVWGAEEGTTNLEIKCVDNSCNPYVALAGIIAAGMDGVRRKLTPPPPVQCDPSTLNTTEMAEGGVKRLPASLKEALRQLLLDQVLMEALGNDFARTFITVKTSESVAFAKHGVEYELEHHRTKF
jgi:glutamine synthetase